MDTVYEGGAISAVLLGGVGDLGEFGHIALRREKPLPMRPACPAAARLWPPIVIGTLPWAGRSCHAVEGDELAVETGVVGRPERPHHLDVFLGAGGSALPRHAKHLELLLKPTDADAELQETTQEVVEGRDFLRIRHGMTFGKQEIPVARPSSVVVAATKASQTNGSGIGLPPDPGILPSGAHG